VKKFKSQHFKVALNSLKMKETGMETFPAVLACSRALGLVDRLPSCGDGWIDDESLQLQRQERCNYEHNHDR
jgi:hypothetical protein